MTTLLAVGVAVLAVGALLTMLPRRVAAGGIATSAQTIGLVLLGAAAVSSLLGGWRAGSRFHAGIAPAVGIDPLSAFFLVLLAVSAVPVLLFAGSYLGEIEPAGVRRALSSLIAAFLLSLVGVLLARNVTVFLACWELMTMLPAAAILVSKRDAAVRSAVYAYVAITHLAGAGVWVAVLLAAHHGALGHPQALAHAGSAVPALIAVAGLIGFGAKAGLIPLHSWLPRAHPVAPAPLSALMSGTMVKVALYGLIRIEFDSLPARPLWLALTLMALGLISAVGGVLWAAAQRELKRLLAYSTVENVGIVALALAAAMLLQHAGDTLWAEIAFAAALLHSLNHALFKTLLFLGAGAFERATATLDLDHLGGLLRRMPWTGGAFLIGALAISGLPPLNGFASEWLVLQSLLHATLHGPLGIALAAAAALAGTAAAAALALLCFVKVSGLVLLGAPRSDRVARATEAPLPMRAAMALLAAGCVLLGIAPGLLLPRLAALLSSSHSAAGTAPLAAHIGLRLPATGTLPTAGIALALLLLTALLWAARGFRAQQRAAAPSWACGQPLVPGLLWSSPAFTKPLRLVLQGLMRPQRELEVLQAGGLTQRVVYSSRTPSLIDRVLYEPTIRVALRGAAVARRLQTGNVRTYAGYLAGLVVLAMVLLGAGVFR